MRTLLVTAVGAAAVILGAAGVSAQTVAPPQGPGLFGQSRPDAGAKNKLDLTLSFVQGYDSDVPRDLQSIVDSGSPQPGGFATTGNASAGYSWRGTRSAVSGNGSISLRHYMDVGETRSLGHGAGIGFSTRLSSRTTVRVNQSASFSPAYFYGLFPTDTELVPGDTPPPTTPDAPDYAVSTHDSYSYATDVNLGHNFSSRSNVTIAGQLLYADRLNETGLWRDSSAQELRAVFTRGLRRNTALHLGSKYWSGPFGYTAENRMTEVALEIGLDYNHRLSATRQVRYRFRIGPSFSKVPDFLRGTENSLKRYHVAPEVGIDYPLSQRWSARADYKRGLEYVIDLPEPVFADSLSVAVNGLVTRRVDLSFSAGYSSGASLLSQDSLTYDTYVGTAQMRYAFTRTVAVYGEYLRYFYDFRGVNQVIAGLPSGLERNGIRVGLTAWLPALRK